MESVEQLLEKLVAFPTVSDRPVTGIAAWMAERLEHMGLRPELIAGPGEGKCNLVVRAGPPDTEGLVLSGHMDVVPVVGQPWTSDPFVLTRRDDRLIGRGSCDMKAFLAAVLSALPTLPLQKLQKELVLVFTHDEEVGCLGSRALVDLYQEQGKKLPHTCLIGEPTSFKIFRMHPGHVALRIYCQGKAAHSSKPDLGRNAILKATQVIARLEEISDEWRRDIRFSDMLDRPFVVMNVATIHGGSAVNIVPDSCVIEVGFRPLPGMDAEALYAQLRERVEALGDVRAELVRVTPSLHTPEGTPLQGLLTPWACDHRTAAAAFATDGGNLERLGVRTLVFGPGSIDVAHQADEYVPVGELHRAVDVVRDVVQKVCL